VHAVHSLFRLGVDGDGREKGRGLDGEEDTP
jgi:hypothetical protein